MCLNCLKTLKVEKKAMESIIDRLHDVKAKAKAEGVYDEELKEEFADISKQAHNRLRRIDIEVDNYLMSMN